jgi:hypothetical protein
VTLVLISVKGFFAKVGVSPTPIAPWQGFPNKAGPAQNGGFLHLDMSFDKARDGAQKHRLRLPHKPALIFHRYHRGGRVFPKSLQSAGAYRPRVSRRNGRSVASAPMRRNRPIAQTTVSRGARRLTMNAPDLTKGGPENLTCQAPPSYCKVMPPHPNRFKCSDSGRHR